MKRPGGPSCSARIAHRAHNPRPPRGHLEDELMPKYAELIYNGFWFSPEREMLQVLIDKSQEMVAAGCGSSLQGRHHVTGRDSFAFALRPGSRDLRGRRGAPTTTTTPAASSSSTRCACGRWRSAEESHRKELRLPALPQQRARTGRAGRPFASSLSLTPFALAAAATNL